ncbi:MAG: tyrosine-type recombinase/integrase [Archangium sp.]|nr:tyrosine-type recombinase/integrase [Archangium sp.]
MKWDVWLALFLERHCTARGLNPRTIAAYGATLQMFRTWVRFRLSDKGPDQLTARDVLEYVDYLRRDRHNGAAAVNRQVTILKSLFRAVVAMGHIEPDRNPMAHFPTIKAAPVKLPVFLSEEETQKLLAQPRTTTVLGLRDRALMTLLYGTGIRATEAATLKEKDVDLGQNTIRVLGKGGHERVLPLNVEVSRALAQYRSARGRLTPVAEFFRSRAGAAMSRGAIYERVRTTARKARIERVVSPHRLRHTFATHLVQRGVQLVTIRDLLGHRSVSSTQIYLHTTAADLRRAAERHPVEQLIQRLDDLLPHVRLPLQWLPGEKVVHRH